MIIAHISAVLDLQYHDLTEDLSVGFAGERDSVKRYRATQDVFECLADRCFVEAFNREQRAVDVE